MRVCHRLVETAAMTRARHKIGADFKIRVFLRRDRRLRVGDGQIVPSRRVGSNANDGKRNARQRRILRWPHPRRR